MDVAVRAAQGPPGTVARGLRPAILVVGGALLSLVGLTWDIQWHTDVGPDTFFTLPHLFLYAGSAVAGIASLVVVLATTVAERRGTAVDPIVGGQAVGVFGRTFAAPVGYLVSGTGAALFLLYGLWDQWWHGLYGFDATIASPPHIGFLLAVEMTMVGAVMIFAVARSHRWGQVGLLVSVPTWLIFSLVTAMGLEALPAGGFDPIQVGVAFMCVLLLALTAGLLDHRGGVVLVAAVVGAMQVALWLFAPWAARVYADASGLPLRDNFEGTPRLPALIPMVLVVVAGLIALLRRRPVWLTGAVAGFLIAGCGPLQQAWVYGTGAPDVVDVVLTAVIGAVVAAGAGVLGARCAQLMRQLAPREEVVDA